VRHHGYVERARNGILFLDEVGELPMLMQVKLLRLIQERVFTRVGGETPIKTSARIICATNTDLEAAVGAGGFRPDLYYRINVIAVAMPPLRDRSDDILPLARRSPQEFSEAFERDVHGFTSAAEQALLSYPWPGNELRNRVERAVALSQVSRIGVEALFPSEATEATGDRQTTLAQVRDRAERRHIRAVLADVHNRIEETAKRLGRSRRRPPGQGSPPAPAPTPPHPVRPKPRSGGAPAAVEVTEESASDAVARRTVSRGKTRDFGRQRRRYLR
jgi:DNA-binding NtrC family response regulator